MPIPLIVPILVGAGGLIAGMLVRQPEINRLKKQVKLLQAEIARLQIVLKEQTRQVSELKIRYNAIKSLHFLEKRKVGKITRGTVIFQYAWREYLELTIHMARAGKPTEEEKHFFVIFETLISENDVGLVEKLFLKNYIASKYDHQIRNLIPLEAEEQTNLVRMIEAANVN
jgi:hypothetical protein